MRLLVAILSALLVAALARPAAAHGTRTATLVITAVSSAEATIAGSPGLRVTAPGCESTARTLRCPGGLAGATVTVEGVGRDVDVVLARATLEGGETRGVVLTARDPSFALPGGEASVFARYTHLGVEHVLSGFDHVLFLIALFFQALAAARGLVPAAARELVRTATAFTVAHSLTLGATALGVLHIPGALAEAAIAASLVVAARGVAKGVSSRRRLGLAAAFGLVHGLGFAGALSEIGLPRGALAEGLFAFNVGVELGQIALLAACLGLVLAVRALRTSRAPSLVSAYAIGSAGAFLFFVRASSLFHL